MTASWRFSGVPATLPTFRTRPVPSSAFLRRSDVTEQEIETKVIKIVSEQMSLEKETITRDTSF
ncbi:MAG: hypothetical protein ACKPEA_17265, partial [Planctomycetota bacterium]